MAETLKVREAADLLSVHVETVRRLIKSRRLTAFRLGRDYRIETRSLYRYMEENAGPNPRKAPS